MLSPWKVNACHSRTLGDSFRVLAPQLLHAGRVSHVFVTTARKCENTKEESHGRQASLFESYSFVLSHFRAFVRNPRSALPHSFAHAGHSTPKRSARATSACQLPSSSGMPPVERWAKAAPLGIAGQSNLVNACHARTTADKGRELRDFGREMFLAPHAARIHHQHEHTIAQLVDRTLANRHAAQQGAGQDFNHQRQAKTLVRLVAPHRANRAGRIGIQRVRIVRRAPFGIQQPAVRACLSGDALDAHLPLGRRTGAKIEHQRPSGAGTPKASGFVPSRGARPPTGATRRAAPCVLTISSETMPASAACSQYSPNRPICPLWISVPTHTPPCRAFLISLSVRSRASDWPKPQWPSAISSA